MPQAAQVFTTKRVKLTANGYTYLQWKVEGRMNRVRIRRHFSSKEEAEGFRQIKEIEAINRSDELRPSVTHLTTDELRQAEAAFRRLDGKSLEAAVEWFLSTHRDTLSTKTVAEVYEEFLTERADHVRPNTLSDYRGSLKAFAAYVEGRQLPAITSTEVEAFLKSRNLKSKSWNNTRADLNGFFAWCLKAPRKWIASNPVQEVATFNVARTLPEIITVAKAVELMEFLESFVGHEVEPLPPGFLVPYFALALFAGIRPAFSGGELVRLANLPSLERHFDLGAGVIRITPEIAKTNDLRQITIQPNLAAWLNRYPPSRFPIFPPLADDQIVHVRKKFSLGHDVLRHTFISMHVARFRSMADTALQAGNSESMIKKHYLNLVTPKDAEKFWAIVPKGRGAKRRSSHKGAVAASAMQTVPAAHARPGS
jgi:hypothetical protein